MAYEQGGWYNGQQYWGGQLGPQGVIINPNQAGFGLPVGTSAPTGGSAPTPTTTAAPPIAPPPPPAPTIQSNVVADERKKQLGSPLMPGVMQSNNQVNPGTSLRGPLQSIPAQTPTPSPVPTPTPAQAPQAIQSKIANNPNVEKSAVPSLPKIGNESASQSVTTATNKAIQSGADPAQLSEARKYMNTRDYVGYCQSFVERVTGQPWQGASAIDAWNRNKQNSVLGLQGLQPGDAVYFAPDKSNNGYGHTGIYAGNGQFISATYDGVKQFDLGNWVAATGQRILGYIPMAGRVVGGAIGQGIGALAGAMGGQQNPQALQTQLQQLQQRFAQLSQRPGAPTNRPQLPMASPPIVKPVQFGVSKKQKLMEKRKSVY